MKIASRFENEVVVFAVDGEIRRTDSMDTTLHQLVKDQLENGRRKVLLNLEGVSFIDSFGVGEVLASYISTHNLGGQLKISNIARKLFVIFQVTMLTKVLDIYDSEEKALQSFSRS